MFVALVKGEGEGCDYTIGCNVNFKFLKANTWAEARQEAADMLENDQIAEITILEVAHKEEFDVEAFHKKLQDEENQRKQTKYKEERRKLFEELREEFRD